MAQSMPTNRIFKDFITNTSASQAGLAHVVFPSANMVERAFSGPIRFCDLLEQEVEAARARAKQEAKAELQQEIENQQEQLLLRYFTWIARIGVFVDETTRQFAQEIVIESYQAQCDFRSHGLSVYFVIKGSFEDEMKFASIINTVEQIVLLQDKRIVEIFYSNAQKEIDYAALKLDYPFVFDLKKLKDAFQQPSVHSTSQAQS
jgi:hypothetical protein